VPPRQAARRLDVLRRDPLADLEASFALPGGEQGRGRLDAPAHQPLLEAAAQVRLAGRDFRRQPQADVERIYDMYNKGRIFDRVPYVLAPAVKSIVSQQVDPRLAADLKAFDFRKVVDNSTVDRLVKEGYFEQLFGADVKAEAQQRAKIAFGK